MDFAVSFPARGVIHLKSQSLFRDANHPDCRRFLECVFQAKQVSKVEIRDSTAELRYCPDTHDLGDVVGQVASYLKQQVRGSDGASSQLYQTNGYVHGINGHHGPSSSATEVEARPIGKAKSATDRRGIVRYFRNDAVVSGWEVKQDTPGRLKLKNPVLYRKAELCQAIERELMSVLGVDKYKTSPLTSTVVIDYDPRELTRAQVIEIIDSALENTEHPTSLDKLDLHLPICTASLPLAAVAQFAFPPLLPVAAVVFAYTSIPTFKEARAVLFEERRLGVDVLDAIVVVGCLGTMSIFPGAVLCWCLGLGKVLVKRTQDNSKKLLLNAFGKQPRYVWLYREGVEVQVSMDRLQQGDIIVVNTGEVVPVDGVVVEGMAMIDQHALTGESTPAEKGVGDRVFASTLMVAGKVFVSVEKSGSDTASAKISQILNDSAGYKLSSQHKGERLADKAVVPTLAVGAVGLATMGPFGAVAVLNSDFGTGIRMAAPLAMLSSLALCANKGILVKDGRALELMNEIDTVLFDKTGTLTRERPEVGRIVATNGFTEDRILQFAAAAERKFHHPIALAILHKAKERSLELPTIDDTQYKVGYGITVHVEGHLVRVGSKRFMEMEGVELPQEVRESLEVSHVEGHTVVMVSVDGQLGGAIELQAAVRPEIPGDRRRFAKARDQAPGDHLGRPRRPDPEAGGVVGHGPLLRPGPAGGQGRIRRAAPEGRSEGLLRRGRDQRLDRPQEGQRVDLAPRGVLHRHRHGPYRFPRRRPGQALRASGHLQRPRQERQAELEPDPGPEYRVHRGRVHPGFRDHGLGGHQQRRRPGGPGEWDAPAPQDRPD